MWQQIIVILIGIWVLYYIGRKMYGFFVKAKRKENVCIGCNGCKLKEELLKNIKNRTIPPQDVSSGRKSCCHP